MTRTGYGDAEEAADAGGPAEESTGTGGAAGPVCELCGARMLERHCKIVCLNCGYQRDCSDP